MAIENIEASSQDRRSVYTVWLRFIAFIGVLGGTIILVSPSFLFSYADPNLPWNEQSRILAPGQAPAREPSADQPKISDALHYRVHVRPEGFSRGKLNFIISPQGAVRGVWNGEYDDADGSHCTILAASFTGNTDPAKPCIEQGVHDASKLYFISSGSFSLLETSASTGRNRGVNGFIYVRGWLDPNYVAAGELFITENKKSYEVYCWSDEPLD